MKIAILSPSPIPFTTGGAEKLWWGLQEYINKHTPHQCELIKIPTKENSFWDLIDSYYTFYTLDLSHFDLLITGKYPAWMSRHPQQHIYMLHCLRGLYDTYHFSQLPLEFSSSHTKIQHILHLLEDQTTSADELFKLLFQLRDDLSIPGDTFNFPGSFIRKIIHFFDQQAMQQVKYFSAISNTVAGRKEYFPANANINTIYPPSNLTHFNNTAYEYFFVVSRLDNAKRIQMIVEAYLQSDTNIPLKIAGSGPLSESIKSQTEHDQRIVLLGFVSDDELIVYYANAFAVIFIPYEEDYGLITIEAMMSEKPVLTFNDSGGVLEFVEHNKTGLICEPDVRQLTTNIDYLSEHPHLCKSMGKAARTRVQEITWQNTVAKLLATTDAKINSQQRIKVTVVTTYPIYPPRGGGQNRVFYLYKELARTATVEVICLVNEREKFSKTEIASNLFEIRIPKSASHAEKERKIEANAGIPITDIAMLDLYAETVMLRDAIQESYITSDFLIATQPYTYPLCKSITSEHIIHDSQNVEYSLKKQMLKDTPFNRQLLKKLFEAESHACNDAWLTSVCAMEDAVMMEELYNFDKTKALLVPNGVDLLSTAFITQAKRQSIKTSLQLEQQKIIIFMASWHQPNIEAVEEIFKIASKTPDFKYIIIGSVGNYFAMQPRPANVGFTGVVDDAEKVSYLSLADIAINPMLSGSGTNLKMLDYMASGIPVISTVVGARGLNIPAGLIAECDIDQFDFYINNIENHTDISSARKYVEQNFGWDSIVKNLQTCFVKDNG